MCVVCLEVDIWYHKLKKSLQDKKNQDFPNEKSNIPSAEFSYTTSFIFY